MIEIFEESISWEKLKINKENCSIKITRGSISRESEIFTIYVSLNFIVPYNDHLKIIKLIEDKVGASVRIRIEYEYNDIIQSKADIIKSYFPYLTERIFVRNSYIARTVQQDGIDFSDKFIKIPVVGAIASEELNGDVKKLIEKAFKEDVGIDIVIEFYNNGEIYEDKKRQVLDKDKKDRKESRSLTSETKARTSSVTAEKTKYGRGEAPVSGNILLGKRITKPISPLGSINKDSGETVVEGNVFKLESKDTKTGKKIVMMFITDENTSVYIKCFMSQTKWHDIKSNINIGSRVKVQGTAEYDSYERCVVLTARSIEKGKDEEGRRDDAEIKRVELHAHTKMSAMDGLSDPVEMINLAVSFGHSAVAVTDHGVVQAFPDCAKAASKSNIKIIYGLEGYLVEEITDSKGNIDYKTNRTNHIILLAKNQTGLKNLYKIVSISHLSYFYRKPRITRALLDKFREGIIVGGACEAGEIYQAFLKNKSDEEKMKIAERYDYFEIQPLCNNQFMVDNGIVDSVEDLKTINKEIIDFGKKLGKLTVATCDSHYLEKNQDIYRTILQAGQGYQDIEGNKGLYFRTTEEMLGEFEYLGKELAYEVVVVNSNKIAEEIEVLKPVPDGKFPPRIDGAEEILRKICSDRVHEIYGEKLPEIVEQRLERELNSIIGNGYAVMYVSAEKLVQKSIADGYLVGSRGSVGSSFAATMGGITEVNPLIPHYVCPECKHSEFIYDGSYDCGVDMPDKNCPVCGTLYKRDGFNIPFEVFLGFEGDKEPDIDLNFAGEYQPVAHKFVEDMFGKNNVFRAGTIGTIAQKTAFGFVLKYMEQMNKNLNRFEIERIANCCVGVRRTTGQHPGGIIIVPEGHEIYEFCPVQRPANDTGTEIITTHFDYHSIDQNLLKLDILGHDVPSMIRQLQDLTGIDPLKVPLRDDRVMSIFNGIDGLSIKDDDYEFVHGSYGIPEFGTKFVRQMLDDIKPSKFADLIRISGFSHGTNVWLNNARDFLKSGDATMENVISTRDDIMTYLRKNGVSDKSAFKIMESVRKGKGLTEEQEAEMLDSDIPKWYIESCKRIQYMFPKAHAVAYVMMAYRIAYYKVYYPVEFYAVIFTVKVADFDASTILKGKEAISAKMKELENCGRSLTAKEEGQMVVYELAYEMYARGFEFLHPQIGDSKAIKFTKKEGKVLLPLVALEGVGENAAKAINNEFQKKEFCSIEDMRTRCKLNKNAVEALTASNAVGALPVSNQLSLF